jgi:hypothetical protein
MLLLMANSIGSRDLVSATPQQIIPSGANQGHVREWK